MGISEDIKKFNNPDYNLVLEYLLAPQYAKFFNSATQEVYPFTNERLWVLFDCLNLKNKRVATVGSSGDQAFYAVFNGSKDVTIIDGCVFAEPYIELKKAAILNLSYDEFIDFMCNTNWYDHKIYSKLSHDLSPRAKKFWDNLYLEGIPDEDMQDLEMGQYRSRMYFGSRMYKDEESFKELKEKLSLVNFKYINAEFNEFPKKLKGKYDCIILSNVSTYIKNKKEFFSVVKELEEEKLNSGGVMQLHYQFNMFSKTIKDQYEQNLPGKLIHYLVSKHDSLDENKKTDKEVDTDKVFIADDTNSWDYRGINHIILEKE